MLSNRGRLLNEEAFHLLALVSCMISSVVILTVAAPRSALNFLGELSEPIFLSKKTRSPSSTNSTSLCGVRPSFSLICCGMVTCPLDVIRVNDLLLSNTLNGKNITSSESW